MIRALICAALGLSLCATPVFADAAADAGAAMAAANNHLEKREYDAAIASFNEARELSPTASGPYLGLGLAYAASGHCDEAVGALDEYFRRRTKDPKPEAKAARESCKTKMSVPGKLRVESTPTGAEVRLDAEGGPSLGNTPFDVASLPPGAHRVYVRKSGYTSRVTDVKIEAGILAQVFAALEPAKENDTLMWPSESPAPAAAPPAGTAAVAPTTPPATGETSTTTATTTTTVPDAAAATSTPGAPAVSATPGTTPGAAVVASLDHKEAVPAHDRSMRAHLTIESNVESSVYINEDRVSTGAIADLDLPPGAYHVSVESEGFASSAGTVILFAGERQYYQAQLKRLKRTAPTALGALFTVLALGGAGTGVAGHVLADETPHGIAPFILYHQLEEYGYIGGGAAAGVATVMFIVDGVINRGRIDEGKITPLKAVHR